MTARAKDCIVCVVSRYVMDHVRPFLSLIRKRLIWLLYEACHYVNSGLIFSSTCCRDLRAR